VSDELDEAEAWFHLHFQELYSQALRTMARRCVRYRAIVRQGLLAHKAEATRVTELEAELGMAEEAVSSLRAELSEERAHQLQAAKDYSNTIGPMIRERDASRAIVEAATALVENWYPLGHNFRDVCGEQENEMLYRALDDAVKGEKR